MDDQYNSSPRLHLSSREKHERSEISLWYSELFILKQIILYQSNPHHHMSKWYCPRCGFMYNEAVGDENLKIPPKTLFSSFDSSWVCPRCQTPKELFVEVMA